tara:strand:+ start:122 stop:283 length:162 start_codon:yes stop_codon:yes gene_type:complete
MPGLKKGIEQIKMQNGGTKKQQAIEAKQAKQAKKKKEEKAALMRAGGTFKGSF